MDSDAIREKWDARYRDSHSSANTLAAVLTNHQHLLPPAGKALDLASGLGGNALLLAQHGLEVHAWDISPIAIERLSASARQQGLAIHTLVRDCLARPPAADSFDVIVVSRFLERALCPALTAALRPGGLLFYQTYSQVKRDGDGPNNPHFLLATGELLTLFDGLEVMVYQEGEEARFIGRKQ